MRLKYGSVLAAALVMLVPLVVGAQDAASAVAGGGISAKGWTGKIDASEEKAGQTLNNAKLAQEGNALHVTTGPAVAYWNPANKAAGNYTVKATFTEDEVHGPERSPAPVRDRDRRQRPRAPRSRAICTARRTATATSSCADSGPKPFQMNGRRGEANRRGQEGGGHRASPSRRKSPSRSKGTRSSARSTAPSSAATTRPTLVTAGKLKSTDGVYGIRFAHNTEATVTGLTMTKN